MSTYNKAIIWKKVKLHEMKDEKNHMHGIFFIHRIKKILNYFVERKPLISEECLLVMVYENSISIFRTEYSTAYVGYLNIYQNQNLFSDDCHPSRIKQNFFI